MLILETGMLGTFLALDLFVFYVFWEVMLIPMYFIIGIWGGDRRLYASIKFVLYTMVGSLLMLVAILYLYVQYHDATGGYSFDYVTLSHLTLPFTPQMLCFGAFALAFASRCRSSRCTPGCPTRTSRRRRPARWCWRRDAEVRHLRPPALRLADVPAARRSWRRCSPSSRSSASSTARSSPSCRRTSRS